MTEGMSPVPPTWWGHCPQDPRSTQASIFVVTIKEYNLPRRHIRGNCEYFAFVHGNMGGKHSKTSPSLEDVSEENKKPREGEKQEGTSTGNNRLQKAKLPPIAKTQRNGKTTNPAPDALYVVGEELPARVRRPFTPRRRQTSLSLAEAPRNVSLSGSQESLTSSEDTWYTDNSSLNQLQYQDYQYPFENVVFEGGGVKGLAYAGAIRELENIGVWKNIKRFAGTSAGSMWAALAALGYNSYEVEEFLRQDLRGQFLDARFGYCSILPNLIKHFGWHPGRKIFTWFGKAIEAKTNNANITFKELYDIYGKELCVVVTNVNMMDAEYCHVKTTPSLPIRTAVRMSMAIPGLFGAVKYKRYGKTDVYVDGGVLKRIQQKEEQDLASDQYAEVVEAFEIFFKVLDESQMDQNASINKEELAKAFEKSEFNDYYANVLFGDDYNVSDVFEYLDINGDAEINFNELIAFAQLKGIGLQNMFQGYNRREIASVVDFLGAVQDTMLVNVKRVFLTEDDIYRTIGIDTLYVGTTDWDMEEEDKTFLIQQGERAARSFLRHYVKHNDPPLKESMRADSDALTRPLHH
ncbi:Triacylglycerol lipase SDP1 [Holothuria leucospilota]|uniref:Triacylglycerol lipase SDP1 n=1 Tax=Holothuria leucospilota TaxID=206669 RepID=A0A9Q0YPZ8_HOLLE|nr:Triacylglycerol lipase SDP1 [Holothuria leucospilota]